MSFVPIFPVVLIFFSS